MRPYMKPHLTFDEQIDHLVELGLECPDKGAALTVLHDVGYYRLTAYTYPFRVFLPLEQRTESTFQYRADGYIEGARLHDAIALCRFDQGLRAKTFDGIAALELALRVQIAYVLGERDKFGHVNRDSLDGKACRQPPPWRQRETHGDMFEFWLSDYYKLIGRASGEDFIGHAKSKYSNEIPIWIAIETFDFGGLSRLFGLLNRHDQSRIASRFGVSNGTLFHKFLIGIGGIRNHCAHHNRLWNRQLTSDLAGMPQGVVGEAVSHVHANRHRRKIYVWLAILAYSIRSLATQMGKFPTIENLTPESEMGFPTGWHDEPLWTAKPAQVRSVPGDRASSGV
jgi:abortive infection bacteriophage resistance protein